MFIMREVWLLVFKYPSQAQVDNEYSKDDIMLKGRVIRENIPHLPYHDHGTKTLFSLD